MSEESEFRGGTNSEVNSRPILRLLLLQRRNTNSDGFMISIDARIDV
jgi:hypothetical protein